MNKNKALWIVSGILTLLCVILFKDFLLLKKAYFFSDISSDGFYLGYPLLYNLADCFNNIGIPQWSFKVGMGQNMFPFLFRDPFDIILYLAGKENILSLIVYVDVLKIILTGLVFFKYLKALNLSDLIAITGSLLFAFCGFITVGSAWFIFTFEAFNFALLLYGFELFFSRKKWVLLSFAVFLICISMPFNLYVYGVFMGFYAAFRHFQSHEHGLKTFGILLLRLLGITIIGIFKFTILHFTN